MTPTPPSSASFLQTQLRNYGRARRLRNANALHAPDAATPTQILPIPPIVADEAEEAGEDVHGREEEDDDDNGDDDDDADVDAAADADVEEEDADNGVDIEENSIEGHGDEEGGIEEVPMDLDSAFDPTALGLKEIGNLASWTVSTCKPGCGVEALRDEDTNLFWQSDGPQPHHLNIHFSRLVSILAIRLFLDFEADESYTPTRVTLLAGTGYHDLLPFSSLEFTQPKGWIDVPLEHVGGGDDGKTLRAFLVQVKVVENHQNGKDTHIRGLKVFARDERVGRAGMRRLDEGDGDEGGDEEALQPSLKSWILQGAERGFLLEPSWMGEPELR